MKHYHRTKLVVVIFVLAYPLMSSAALVAAGGEFFPFFTWALFCFVPNECDEFSVKLFELDGNSLEPPRYFQDAGDLLLHAESIRAYWTIQRIGRSIRDGNARDGNAHDLAKHRQFFESNFIGADRSVRYQLVLRTYDPLERWKRETCREVRVIKSFYVGAEDAQ